MDKDNLPFWTSDGFVNFFFKWPWLAFFGNLIPEIGVLFYEQRDPYFTMEKYHQVIEALGIVCNSVMKWK